MAIVNIYTTSFVGSTTFNFPNVPALGNSLFYCFSVQGTSISTGSFFYNGGSGPHDVDFSTGMFGFGNEISSGGGGGNGANVLGIWTQGVQAAFSSVTIGPIEDGLSAPLQVYLVIYEISGCWGQASGDPTIYNSNPPWDWKEGGVYPAGGAFVAFTDTINLEPSSNDCSCPPPGNCGANDHQAKFTLGADKDIAWGIAAVPHCVFFDGPPAGCDPCDPAYSSDDFIFAVCCTGSADAQTVLDTIQGTWVIDYQPTNAFGSQQIFAHLGPVITPPPPGIGNIVVAKRTNPATSALKMFGFTPSWGSGFSLHDGQSTDSGPIATGSYSIAETAVAGWSSSAVVSSGDPINALNLTDGQTISVTFTNSPTIPTISTLAKVYPWVS